MESIKILVIDDERAHAMVMAESLERVGHTCFQAGSGEEGLEILKQEHIDIVITDLVMKGVDGMEILRTAKSLREEVEVIVVTGYASVETAVKAMEKGAATYLRKPLNIQEIRAVVDKQVEKIKIRRLNVRLKERLRRKEGIGGIIGKSGPMRRIHEIIRQIAPTAATVYIYGESGTGKELAARAIHQLSRTAEGPFVALNCAALSEGILESELFGHEKGSFTGAAARRIGRFEAAHGGTLFLDEVGDIPLSMQVKLLRVIEDGEVVRMGSNAPIKVEARLITATNQRLEHLVAENRFREDLYFRLKVVSLELPPLRQRRQDIPLLVSSFINEFSERHGKDVTRISPGALDYLIHLPWPGNVRELRNAIENMVVMCEENVLREEDVPTHLVEKKSSPLPVDAVYGKTLKEIEKEVIRETLREVEGHREKAAKMLGIGERTLYRKIKEYEI